MIKNTAKIVVWLWMVLILNSMFQSCFIASSTGNADPINSIVELVLEGVFDVADDLITDEHSGLGKKLKLNTSLHWQCDLLAHPDVVLQFVYALAGRLVDDLIFVNYSTEVLLPPPDALA